MPPPPTAETIHGRVRGVRHGDVAAFWGIPFGTAPRFAPPEVVPDWAEDRDAVVPGPVAPQPARAVARFTHGAVSVQSEECLNLNVFAPSDGGGRPVLVWIHGGGFAIGSGSASLYDGAGLARSADIVVVTLNYRLGSLGWLSHPELATSPGAATGNWALLDQIAALRWVRENIGAFGGDPGRVTVAGQSAGALCAMDLLISPPAAELFHRVVVQSPPLVDLAQRPEVATGWAQALSGAAGSAGPFDRARLMELPAERIVELHEHLLQQPGFVGTRGGALPTIDPATIPASPREDPGASPDIDVLIGSTAQEATFFFGSPWRPAPPPERIPGIVAHLCDTDEPAAVIARYRDAAAARGAPTDDPALLIEIATDAMVAGPAARWATARATALTGRPAGRGGRVYRYRVDHPGAGPALSATHTTEVPLLFGTWRDGGAGERLGGQAPGTAEVAREVASAWAGFVHDGAPGWGPVHGDDAPSEMGIFGGLAPLSVVSLSANRDDSEMCVP